MLADLDARNSGDLTTVGRLRSHQSPRITATLAIDHGNGVPIELVARTIARISLLAVVVGVAVLEAYGGHLAAGSEVEA